MPPDQRYFQQVERHHELRYEERKTGARKVGIRGRVSANFQPSGEEKEK
jgi:hypothetical protein